MDDDRLDLTSSRSRWPRRGSEQLGGSDLSQKGIARSGEAYCLECGNAVEESAEKCQSCGANLDEVVKAFSCPRCQSLLALGTSECSRCGMKFKVKALKQRGDSAEDDDEPVEAVQAAVSEAGNALAELLEAADRLIAEKSAILSRMVNRRAEEKKRLSKMDASEPQQDLVEAEVSSLVEDLEDVTRLRSEILSISELVVAVSESMSLSGDTKAKAMSMIAGESEGTGRAGDDVAAKEEQLAKREEMVDRKIKGYAAKKKELMDQEAALSGRFRELEEERAAFDRMRQEATDSGAKEWEEREREIVRRITLLQTVMAGVVGKTDSKENGTMDDGLSDLEASIKMLLDKSSALEAKLDEMRQCEGEMKDLLSVLDKLLGRLPEDAIQEFTSSDAYKLYEKVLDRYGI